MKVLFLDVDGVLNHTQFLMEYAKTHDDLFAVDPGKVVLLKEIVMRTGCKLVLSSAWRYSPEAWETLQRQLDVVGLSIWSSTPKFSRSRAEAIQLWLEHNQDVTHFAIVDDDEEADFGEAFCKTHFDTGLTEGVVDAIVIHLEK